MRGIYCFVFVAGLALGQTQPLSFEVASIKPSPDISVLAQQMQSGKYPFRIDAHRFEVSFFRLRDLIAYAYNVPTYRISGQDALLDGQRWEINASLPEGSTKEQIPQMVQSLLADRFGLKIHRVGKEHAIYALVVAKGGIKMKEAPPDAPAAAPAPADTQDGAKVDSGPAPVNMKQDGKGGASITGTPLGDVKVSPSPDGMIRMEMSKVPMTMLIQQLSQYLDRPVIDMTDLKGNYQVAIDLPISALINLARAQGVNIPNLPPGFGGGGGTGPADAASDPAATSSIFKSMENMGLKLDPRKQSLDDIVVDHIEKTPTEN